MAVGFSLALAERTKQIRKPEPPRRAGIYTSVQDIFNYFGGEIDGSMGDLVLKLELALFYVDIE